MGYKEDQHYSSDPHRPQSTLVARPTPPPLPPRADAQYQSQAPPPYSELPPNYHSQPLTHSWSAQDPRSSSTQSLVPEEHANDDKRTLLLVYIHGFMGNETSFQSFPAHIHNLATVKLANTHHVHTKIYPRYKSRKAIENARDDFSKWLCPHESVTTDVILIGHSMGGILAAEVALLGLNPRQAIGSAFRHRIVGTICFDTPFLGMHPGVIASGIGSLFRPTSDTPGPSTSDMGSQALKSAPAPEVESVASSVALDSDSETQLLSGRSSASLTPIQSQSLSAGPQGPLFSPLNDPNYNPPFPNDVRMVKRTGWGNALHFLNKHSDNLTRATRSYVTSYFEFGGCLADYNGLKDRYSRLRALEEADGRRRNGQPRVRFANYYTASTGRPKKPKLPPKSSGPEAATIGSNDAQGAASTSEPETQILNVSNQSDAITRADVWESLSEETEERGDRINMCEDNNELFHGQNRGSSEDWEVTSDSSRSLNKVDAAPISDEEGTQTAISTTIMVEDTGSNQGSVLESTLSKIDSENASAADLEPSASLTSSNVPGLTSLPPIPPQPQEPPPFDASLYPEKDARKLAEKEHSRQLKAYDRAVKDRDKAIKDRRKLLEKREKTAKQALEKQRKLEEKEITKAKKLQEAEASQKALTKGRKSDAGGESSQARESENVVDEEVRSEKAKKDKKFCMLPPKIDGQVDPCWIRVYMPGVDEVGAHCGLFFVGEQYEWLVSDVGQRIQDWVVHT